MRGLYGIPTRARKSDWYEIQGEFAAKLLSDPDYASFGIGIGTLQFLPNGTSKHYNLIPQQSQRLPKSSSYKVVTVLAQMQPDRPIRKWKDFLYLRRIKPKGAEPFWSILVGPSNVCISDTIIDENGEVYHENLVQTLLPTAKRIQWPDGIPDDENGPEPPAVDYSKYNPQIWGKLKKAILQTIPVEDDQVTPGLTLGDVGMDSLDAVQIWMHIEEVFELNFDEDAIEEVLDSTKTLDDVYKWICSSIEDQRRTDQ